MNIIWSPFYWYMKWQVKQNSIKDEEIKEAIIKFWMKNFTVDEITVRTDILDKLFYPWYTEQYKHIIEISDDDLSKLSDIDFSEEWKIKINDFITVYSSTLDLIIKSAITVKKSKNQDNLRKRRW